ncbi:Glycine--tRNA ligase beta subunit [Candidatus Ecksteinia adelgidicola]|nr:Glycine--tRNA ligase beta subunit [Candidatus Ecksteinia adelgidicola]
MTKKTFLVEIGTEDLPSKAVRSLAESFCYHFTMELKNIKLSYGLVKWFATPRRLTLKIEDLNTLQPNKIIEKRGPAINDAFDSRGKLTKSAISWMNIYNININKTERLITKKGEWLLYRTYIKGDLTKNILIKIVNISLSKLPILKLMRWGNSKAKFIRPVRTVSLLLGEELISGIVLGVESSRIIHGHRFMGEINIFLSHANQYPEILLKKGRVIADYEERKKIIQRDAELAAMKIGGKVDLNEELLEEVTSLVEWPVVLIAKFEKKFLTLPVEALVTTMQENQKYFSVYDYFGNLLPNFIFVSNVQSKDPKKIINGNEKVVRSRLSDIDFFFKTDCKKKLEDYLPKLNTVLFENKLGSMRDKTHRITILTSLIANKINANIKYATRAGLLSKCDLMTHMVFELPNIQGIMGMHYARNDGEEEEVAIAINEQYQPRFYGDNLPQSLVGCSLSIADKIDTLVGMIGIHKYPKSDKDPFGLRRIALGIIRIIINKNLSLDLFSLIEQTVELYNNKLTNIKVVEDIKKFIFVRARIWYEESGYMIDTIQSVLICQPNKPIDFDARIKAIDYFRTLKDLSKLILINKRISNILSKSTDTLNHHIKSSALIEVAEIQLVNYFIVLQDKLNPYLIVGNYQQVLCELMSLHELIDNFFENVMVFTENQFIRINRLTLLNHIRNIFLKVADFSLLHTYKNDK